MLLGQKTAFTATIITLLPQLNPPYFSLLPKMAVVAVKTRKITI